MLARSWILALPAALLFAGGAAFVLERFGPSPVADVARGSEEAFLSGAYPRELTRTGPVRWTATEARYRFVGLTNGSAALDVSIGTATTPATVVVDGVILGQLDSGTRSLQRQIEVREGQVEIRLVTEGRLSGTRRLGAMLGRVALGPQPRVVPSLRSWSLLALPGLAMLWGAWRSRVRAWPGAALAAAATVTIALALWPYGLLFSPYARTLSAALSLGLVAAGLCAAWLERRHAGAGAWALAALLVACAVQGVAATSPLMLVSDAVFHANKLASVAAGHFFPTSVTQHARSFEFPYGVSFYALLAPLYRAGVDGVWLVRIGAALCGLLASAALFALLAATPVRAALATIALQLVPITFDMYSYGNLSNVFAQALTVAFFAWWAGRTPGGPALGALLLAAGCLAHLSGAIVLAVLCVAFAWARRGSLRSERVRLAALGVGLLLAGGYYAHFTGLVLSQLSRLQEGAGSGAHSGMGVWDALREQRGWMLLRWGMPALLLAALGWPRPRAGDLARDLAFFWLSGIVFFGLAVATPLEVRYLYALSLPLAVAMADGILWLGRRGTLGWIAVAALGAWQLWLAWQGLIEAVLTRYRS
jgi:hypothetical protein